MFYVQLASLGDILGPLKSDLGVFWAKIPLYPYTPIRERGNVYHIFWVIQIGIIILCRQAQVARGRSRGDGHR